MRATRRRWKVSPRLATPLWRSRMSTLVGGYGAATDGGLRRNGRDGYGCMGAMGRMGGMGTEADGA